MKQISALGMAIVFAATGCTAQPPAIAIVESDASRLRFANIAAMTERQRTAVHSGVAAARIVAGANVSGTETVRSLAAAVGSSELPMFSNLARAGTPVVSIDAPLPLAWSFCVCGPAAPGASEDRVRLATEILDTALRSTSRFEGTPNHGELVRTLASRRFGSRWGEVEFDAKRMLRRVFPATAARPLDVTR